MAHHAVDRSAYAVGVAFEVEISRDAPMLNRVVVNPLVYFGSGNSWLDMLGNIVEDANIDSGRALDALDFLGAFEERTGHHFVPVQVKAFEAAVNGAVALLVFLSTSAPTFVVASGLWAVVVHSKLLIRCSVTESAKPLRSQLLA